MKDRKDKWWTSEEEAFLRENYKEMTYEEIGEHLGRTAKAVNAKAGRLNLKKKERNKTLPKSAKKPSKALAWLVGYILGDGHLNDVNWSIEVITKDEDLKEYFQKQFEEWSGHTNLSINRRGGGFRKFPSGTRYYKPSWKIYVYFKEAYQFLKQFDEDPLYCLEFFPKKYWKWILKGLWDAEGCISPQTNPNCVRISFGNYNEEIRELYMKICHHLDFHPSVSPPHIEIARAKEVLRFVREIGITVERKRTPEVQERLKRMKKMDFREPPRDWTEKEEEYLRNNYKEMMDKEIAEELDRSTDSVAGKRHRMGLWKRETWSREEVKFLKENYDTMTAEEIGEKLGRSKAAVYGKAKMLRKSKNLNL